MRTIVIASLALLLAACSSAPDSSGGSTGQGTGANAGLNTTGGTAAGGAVAARPGSAEDLQQNVGDRVLFETDQSEVNAEGRKILERQADWLKRYPNVTVTIEGHCDERGTREYNLALGERRASMARQLLLAMGIAANRVTAVTYGKERPTAVGSSEAAWAQNRRAVTVVN